MIGKRKVKSIKPQKKTRVSRILFQITMMIFFGVIIYTLFFSGLLSLARIDVFGCDKIPKEKVVEIISHNLSQKFLGILPLNNLMITYLRSAKIEKGIMAQYREIEKAEIKLKFPSILQAQITERNLAIGLCSGGRCFLVDAKGTAYKDASQEELGRLDIAVLTDASNKNITLDANAIDVKNLEYVRQLKTKLKNELDLDSGKNFETPNLVSSDIRINVAEGWKIFFGSDIEIDREMKMLKIVLDEKIKDERRNLEYIDLRSNSKVFYKLKEQPREENDAPADNPPVEEEEKKKKKK